MENMPVILRLIKERGLKSLFSYGWHQLKNRFRSPRRLNGYSELRPLFIQKAGLEIGGPSKFFNQNGPLPIYDLAKSVDNINHAPTIVWTGKTLDDESGYGVNGRMLGKQFIFDAINLSKLPNAKYDFVFSCNALEHLANPLEAIGEWLRVLKPGGVMVVVVPRKESNFDHRRTITKFNHLISDFKGQTPESDLTHLSEILALHDLQLDPMAGTRENFEERSRRNIENRCLHHHVFDIALLKRIAGHFRLEIIAAESIPMENVMIVRKKQSQDRAIKMGQ